MAILCVANAATFRTVGQANVLQNLFSLEVGASSPVKVAVRKLLASMDATVALTAVVGAFKVSRPDVLPTSGTTLTKVLRDSSFASNTNVVARGGTASDGGALTGIVANANAAAAWAQFGMRLHTAVGQVANAYDLLPYSENRPMVLRPGESLLVQYVASAASSNPATNHYHVNCLWEEFTEP